MKAAPGEMFGEEVEMRQHSRRRTAYYAPPQSLELIDENLSDSFSRVESRYLKRSASGRGNTAMLAAERSTLTSFHHSGGDRSLFPRREEFPADLRRVR